MRAALWALSDSGCLIKSREQLFQVYNVDRKDCGDRTRNSPSFSQSKEQLVLRPWVPIKDHLNMHLNDLHSLR